MANNGIFTPYDDNGLPIASTNTGRTASGVSTSPPYGAMVVASPGNPASASPATNLMAVAAHLYNGATYDPAIGVLGVALTSSGGKTTVAIPVSTASNTVVKASAGRLCRLSITAAAGTTTGTTPIYDNATTNSGTILVVIPNSQAVGSIVDVQFPAANGITVAGGANSPAMTISYI